MADPKESEAGLFVSESLPVVFVFWKQAEPAPFEVAAIHRVDRRFRGSNLAEVASVLKDEDWWIIGPLESDDQADASPSFQLLTALIVRVPRTHWDKNTSGYST